MYRAMEAKRQIQNNMAIAALSLGIIGFLGGGIYLMAVVCCGHNQGETQRKNPTWLDKKTHGTDNIEQQAMDIVIRKKTLLEKEKEIKFMLDYRFGLGTYDEMLGMRRKIRAEREETVYRAMEAKRQIQNNMAIGALSLGIIGVLGGGMYLIVLVTQ